MRVSRWDQQLTTEESNSVVKEIALTHLAVVLLEAPQDSACYRDAKAVVELIREDKFKELCSWDIDYQAYDLPDKEEHSAPLCSCSGILQSCECQTLATRKREVDPIHVYHLRQALAFYQKREDLDIGVDKEEVAWVKFQESERRCAETNAFFKAWSRGEAKLSPCVEQVFHLAQRKITRMLGERPGIGDLKLRFGPGATTNVRRRMASPRNKLGAPLSCSEDLAPAVHAVLAEMPHLVPGLDNPDTDAAIVAVEIHRGQLYFVPKNAKTYRSIVVEPMLNSMCQLGIGDYLAQRFKRLGLNLTDQGRNQALARVGSITRDLATLDLSSASDLIAKELVYHLLPLEWASFLARFRTGKVEYKGQEITLHKFSSMGNGFTFPLESLIFWGLASAASEIAVGEVEKNLEDKVGVYGDDIIVPVGAVALLVDALSAAGFLVNQAKSFWSGPFRESCGKDYFRGIDIRPFYLKEPLSGSLLFTLHNFYVRSWQPEMASRVLHLIAEPLRLWGPDGFGDGHLIGGDPDQYLRPHRRSIPRSRKEPGGWGGWTFDTYAWSSKIDFRVSPGDRIYPVYSIYSRYPHKGDSEVDEHGSFPPLEASTYRYRGPLLGVPTPGKKGYRRIKIYTLNPV